MLKKRDGYHKQYNKIMFHLLWGWVEIKNKVVGVRKNIDETYGVGAAEKNV